MTGREYQLSRYALEVGVVAVVPLGLLGVVHVAAALVNADGAFRHTLATVVVFGFLRSCFILPGIWPILLG